MIFEPERKLHRHQILHSIILAAKPLEKARRLIDSLNSTQSANRSLLTMTGMLNQIARQVKEVSVAGAQFVGTLGQSRDGAGATSWVGERHDCAEPG
jgi:hypothetical protein